MPDTTSTDARAVFRAMFLDCNATPKQRREWLGYTRAQRHTASSVVQPDIETSELNKARQRVARLEQESEERLAALRGTVGIPEGLLWSHSECVSAVTREIDNARQYAGRLEEVSAERLASLRVAVGMPKGENWSHSYCCSQVHEMRGAEIEAFRPVVFSLRQAIAETDLPWDMGSVEAVRKLWGRLDEAEALLHQVRTVARERLGDVGSGPDLVTDIDSALAKGRHAHLANDSLRGSLVLLIGGSRIRTHETFRADVSEHVRTVRGQLDKLEIAAQTATSLTSPVLGVLSAALAPGEALDFTGIVVRAAAYRRHSIQLAAIYAAVDPVVHTEAAGVDPFPWEACADTVNAPHEKVCVLLEAINAAADALTKVCKPASLALHENAIETEGVPEAIVEEIIQDLRERRQWGFVVRTNIRHEWSTLIRRVASSSQPAKSPTEPMIVDQVEAWLVANGCVVKSSPSATSTGWAYTEATDVSALDLAAYEAHGYYVCWTGPGEPVARTLDAIEKVLGRRPVIEGTDPRDAKV